MTPVIRIDDEVMDELKKRAIGLGLVFEPPNATLRIVLGLDGRVKPDENVIELVELKPSPALIPPARRHAKRQYPPLKSVDGKILTPSIKTFADRHVPRIKYEGMHTAIDVLTACKSPEKDKYGHPDYEFHYVVIIRRDGVYIERKPGRGYRTTEEETHTMMKQAGLEN